MNTLLSRGFVDLLFSVIKQESSLLLAVNHDDEAPLNKRAARILCMAHNKRSPEPSRAAPQDPLQVLGLIETEAMLALRATREPQDAARLRAILEAAQGRRVLAGQERKEDQLARRFSRLRPQREQDLPWRMPAPTLGADAPAAPSHH